MESFTIYDGFILTIVAMVVVFLVLGAIGGLVELVAKMIASFQPAQPVEQAVTKPPAKRLVENPKHKKVAELMALILAAEEQPNKKFEIVESKRVHKSGGRNNEEI